MTALIGPAATKMADAIDEAIGAPGVDEDEFGDQMASLCEAIARRIAFTLKQTGNPSPSGSIMSAANIAATAIFGRASALMEERTVN